MIRPPEHLSQCCVQQSLTVPPSVNAKTTQKHDYASARWRRSYARRAAVERSNSRMKDPATIDIQRGWYRVVGLAGPMLLIAVALAVRNLGLVDAFEARQADDARRRTTGLAPRKRRRRTLADLVARRQHQ